MKHLKKAPLLALIALSLSTSACEAVLLGASLAADDEEEGVYGSDDGGFVTGEGNTDIEAASFSGTIGDVSDVSTEADATAYFDGEYASITLTASRSDWGAMVAFDLSGDASDALFTPGSVITLSADSAAFSYGCSGGAEDPYAYETGNQTDGVISVSEGTRAGMLQVDFEVTYMGADAVKGSFQIAAL